MPAAQDSEQTTEHPSPVSKSSPSKIPITSLPAYAALESAATTEHSPSPYSSVSSPPKAPVTSLPVYVPGIFTTDSITSTPGTKYSPSSALRVVSPEVIPVDYDSLPPDYSVLAKHRKIAADIEAAMKNLVVKRATAIAADVAVARAREEASASLKKVGGGWSPGTPNPSKSDPTPKRHSPLRPSSDSTSSGASGVELDDAYDHVYPYKH